MSPGYTSQQTESRARAVFIPREPGWPWSPLQLSDAVDQYLGVSHWALLPAPAGWQGRAGQGWLGRLPPPNPCPALPAAALPLSLGRCCL